MHQNIEIALVQSIQNLRRAEGSPSNRTMTLNTQQEWLIDNSVNVLEWPSHSQTQSNISGETWKCASAPIQPDRAWEVKRWGEEWQIIDKCWWAKLVASNKKDETVKGASAKYEYLCNVLISVLLFVMNLRSCDNSVFALSIWGMECRLMWKKSNLKLFKIRQKHNKTWKKWRGMNTVFEALYLKSPTKPSSDLQQKPAGASAPFIQGALFLIVPRRHLTARTSGLKWGGDDDDGICLV